MANRNPLRREQLLFAAVWALGALLLFWGLSDKYLWQDEAATAVLAERLVKYGSPLAYDGTLLSKTSGVATLAD